MKDSRVVFDDFGKLLRNKTVVTKEFFFLAVAQLRVLRYETVGCDVECHFWLEDINEGDERAGRDIHRRLRTTLLSGLNSRPLDIFDFS